MHRPLFLITAGSVAACGALIIGSALPAAAATSIRAQLVDSCTVPTGSPSGTPCSTLGTPVTFEVTTVGVLSISVPDGPVDLGTGPVGSTIGTLGNFGAVTVIDTRALDPASWTASVSSTAFVNSATPSDVIPVNNATYNTGDIGPANGLGTSAIPANGTINLLPTAQDVVFENSYDGDNSANWTPEIDLNVPVTAVLGTYVGTVTHSVS